MKKKAEPTNPDLTFSYLNVFRHPKSFFTTVVMNHPPRLKGDLRINTIGPGLLVDLDNVLDILLEDPKTRVIVLRGSNGCFSGGGDLAEPLPDPWQAKKFSSNAQRIFKRFRDMPKPVIAAIEGQALGGGLELAMSCDLRLASEDASLGLLEVTVGLIPGWGGTQLMTRHIGLGRTMELILTGEVISAQRAFEIGLVNRVFDNEHFAEGVYRMAKSIADRCSPISVGIAKQMASFGESVPLDIGLAMETYGFGLVTSTEDFQEGIRAYLQGRKPRYKNK